MTPGESLFEAGKNKAIRLLLFRSRSRRELREKLQARGFPPDIVDEVTRWLEERGYLDDRSYAENLARILAVNRLWGNFRILLALRERGIPPFLAEEALQAVRRDLGEREAMGKYIQKKYGKTGESDINSKEFTLGERHRLFRSLSSRGFPRELIMEIISMPKEEKIHDGE